MAIRRILLDDGSQWPVDPEGELARVLKYGKPTSTEALSAASLLNAYDGLVYGFTTTEAAIKKLRMLRRAAKDEHRNRA